MRNKPRLAGRRIVAIAAFALAVTATGSATASASTETHTAHRAPVASPASAGDPGDGWSPGAPCDAAHKGDHIVSPWGEIWECGEIGGQYLWMPTGVYHCYAPDAKLNC